MKKMFHPKFAKDCFKVVRKPEASINLGLKECTKVIDFVRKLYGVLAFSVGDVALGVLNYFKRDGVAPRSKVGRVLSGIHLRPALLVRAADVVKRIAVNIILESAGNLHRLSPSRVLNVGRHARVSYRVNHRAAVAKRGGVLNCVGKCGKLGASAFVPKSANCGKGYSVFEAVGFVCVKFSHFSFLCLYGETTQSGAICKENFA